MDAWQRCPYCGTRFDPEDTSCRHCGATPPTAVTMVSDDDAAAPSSAELEQITVELRRAFEPGRQLVRFLAAGGMGAVYLGRDPGLKRLIVIKVLAPALAHDEVAHTRFLREAQAAAATNHPHIVSVYEVGELPESRVPYFIMQYVDGGTIRDEMQDGVAVSESRAKRLVGEIASALAEAHRRGLIHRDIKPANVMVERESGRALVVDFGISAATTPEGDVGATDLTIEGSIVGTPQYMSPEQAAGGRVTEQSDVYSLGIMAFELVTGAPPFNASSPMGLIAAHIKDPAPPVRSRRPDLDAQFADLIDRSLAKDPAARPSADAIARALVPPAQPWVEWPPPGLERLRGVGAAYIRLVGINIALLVGVLLLFAFPPTSMIAWGEPDRFSLWSPVTLVVQLASIGNTASIGPGIVWLLFLGLFALTGFLMAVMVLARGAHLGWHLKWARRAGYPWRVVLDTAVDRSSRTGALLNRLGVFASLPPDVARRFMKFRRISTILVVVALAAGGLSAFGWFIGATGGWASGGGLLPPVELVVTLLPLLLGLGGALAMRVPEWRYVRRMIRGSSRRRISVRGEVVAAWLAAAAHRAPRRANRLGSMMLAGVPGIGAAAVTFVLAVTVLYNVLVVTISSQGAAFQARDAREWLRAWQHDTLVTTAWPTFDSILTDAGVGSPTPETADREWAQLLVLALQTDSTATFDSAWAVDTTGWRALVERFPHPVSARRVVAWAAIQAGRLPDSTRNALAADTMVPALTLWRQVAAAQPPPLWMIRRGFPGFDPRGSSPLGTRWHRLRASVIDFQRRNAAAAALLTAAGDTEGAERRAREIISVGHAFLRQPVYPSALTGSVIVREGARTLQWVGRLNENRRLVDQGQAILDVLDRDDVGGWSGLWIKMDRPEFTRSRIAPLLMSNPADTRGLGPIGDGRLAPFVRWELIRAIYGAYCLSVRETRYGPDPRRMAMLDSARVLAADVPRTDEWVAAIRRAFEERDTENVMLCGY